MKILWAIALPLLLALSGCGERGAKGETPHFQVEGEAKLEKEAELFRAELSLSERAEDRMESLRAVSAKLDEIKDKLSRLEGLEGLKLTTSNVKTETVRPTGCDRESSYGRQEYPENCEPIDFISSIKMDIEGEPAEAAGAAVSLLTELGAESANLTGYDVKDRKAAEQEVRGLALADARETAQTLAEQSGSRVGAPLKVRYGQDRYASARFAGYASQKTVVDREAAVRPSVSLDMPPDKVAFEATVTATFALETPQAEE